MAHDDETDPKLELTAHGPQRAITRAEAERRLQQAEENLRQAVTRHEQTQRELQELEERRDQIRGESELARRAIADFEQLKERSQQELASVAMLEQARATLAEAVEARDEVVARAAGAFESAVTVLEEVEAKRAAVVEAHRRLKSLDPAAGRFAPDEPDLLHEPWQRLVSAVKAELDGELESEMVEAAARSHLPSALNALPEHLRVLASQRRNEIQRERMERLRAGRT